MMEAPYEVVTLSDDDRERLERCYSDLMDLASCAVPSVRAASRAALALIAQAMNGEGLLYDLYTGNWAE
jgi:uncharacterized protein DUF6052